MPKAKLSIIIPTFNRANILSNTLNSVLQQTFKHWECLVIDDYSTDGTQNKIQEYVKIDNRIHSFINQRTKGAQGARNTGILNATGDWIIFFDSDDYMHPTFVEKLFSVVQKSNIDVCTCFSNVINKNTGEIIGKMNYINKGNIYQDLLKGDTYVDYNAAIIRKEMLLQIGLLDENCPSFQEWDTHIRISKLAHYSTLYETLVDYYIGGQDSISSNKIKTVNGYLYLLSKHEENWKATSINAYIQFCKITYSLLNAIENKDIKKQKKRELLSLAPSLRWETEKQTLKKIYTFIKRKFFPY